MDEIHTSVTPEYSKVLDNNEYVYLMGLTATHDITKNNDKEIYYKRFCPIIYEYYDSADDGLINKTRFIVVNHYLSNDILDESIEQGVKETVEWLTKH